MSKDKIKVNMNVYDIPIVIETLEKADSEIKKLREENQQLKKQNDDVVEYVKKDWYSKNTIDINKVVIGDWRIDILRMLGEIDDN